MSVKGCIMSVSFIRFLTLYASLELKWLWVLDYSIYSVIYATLWSIFSFFFSPYTEHKVKPLSSHLINQPKYPCIKNQLGATDLRTPSVKSIKKRKKKYIRKEKKHSKSFFSNLSNESQYNIPKRPLFPNFNSPKSRRVSGLCFTPSRYPCVLSFSPRLCYEAHKTSMEWRKSHHLTGDERRLRVSRMKGDWYVLCPKLTVLLASVQRKTTTKKSDVRKEEI